MPINLDLDTNTAIEKFNEWEQLPEGSVQERSYFCQRVKPYLPTLRRILIEHRDTLAQLRHDLQSAKAEAAEYKTRAESQIKTNAMLHETNREVSAENIRLRNVMAEVRGVLITAEGPSTVSF